MRPIGFVRTGGRATGDWRLATGDSDAISAEETSSAVIASRPSPQSLVP